MLTASLGRRELTQPPWGRRESQRGPLVGASADEPETAKPSQGATTMQKHHLYRTALVNTDDLTGMAKGEPVALLSCYDEGQYAEAPLYTICSCQGLIQAMVPTAYLTDFVL